MTPSCEGPRDAADDVPYVDMLVREYLLYRGCSGALAAFDAERGEGQAFDRADRVAELIFGRHVPRLDAVGLSRTLRLLRDRYFCRLDDSFTPAVAELETSIARLFVVNATKARRKDKIAALFEAEGERLVALGGDSDREWHRWFAVPYVERPASDPRFAPYFEDAWADAVVASARNFLSTTFAAAPEPAVLRFGAARRERNRLERRVAALELELAGLRETTRAQTTFGSDRAVVAPNVLDAVRDVRARTDPDPNPDASSPSSSSSSSLAKTKLAEPALAELPSSRDAAPPSASGGEDSGPSGSPSRTASDAAVGTTLAFTRQVAFSLHAPRPVAHARFAPGGALAAGAGDDGAVRVWSVAARDDVSDRSDDGEAFARGDDKSSAVLASLHVGENAVGALAWDVDAVKTNAREGVGGVLYVGTRDASVRVWDVDERAVVADAAGDESFPHCEDLRCSPCGRWIARSAATRDPWAKPSLRSTTKTRRRSPLGRVETWDARTLTCVSSLPLGSAAPCAHELAFDASGRTLAAAGADGEIRVFDVAAGKLVCKWRAHPRGHAATSVAFASDGGETRVFGVGTDGVVAEWSLRAASARGPIRAVDVRDACGVDTRTRLALDPRGRGAALTSAIANGAVAVFEGTRGAENGGRAVSLPGRGAAARCVDWHPTRSAVLAGCVDGTSMLTTLEMS